MVVKTRKRSRKTRLKRHNLQKPNGVIAPRVVAVGPRRFALVCIDPAKRRSRWMMADLLGDVLIEPATVEHTAGHFRNAIAHVRLAAKEHAIQDMIVVVERTGTYHEPPRRAFAGAGFDPRCAARSESTCTEPCPATPIASTTCGRAMRYQSDETDRANRPMVRCGKREFILKKIMDFHRQHATPAAQTMADLNAVVDQLPKRTRSHESEFLSEHLESLSRSRKGPTALGELLPAVLARLCDSKLQSHSSGDAVPNEPTCR